MTSTSVAARQDGALRIGAVSLCSVRGRDEENLERIVAFGEQAAASDCRLVVFPEFSVCGPWVSYDRAADPEQLEKCSEPVPGRSTELLAGHARRLGLAFCVGVAEAGLTSRPFNTQVVVDRDGSVHRQRKLQPTVSEQAFFRGGGDDVAAFSVEGRSVGIAICADSSEVRVIDRYRDLGVDVLLAPSCGAIKKYQKPGTSWDEVLGWYRRRADERFGATARHLGATFISVDAKDPRSDFADLPERPHYVAGITLAYGPDGRPVASSPGNDESLLVIDV